MQKAAASQMPVVYEDNNFKFIQYNPIEELNQLFSLLRADDTSMTYQKAAEKTWALVKKTIVLLLFVLCFTLALPIWLAGVGGQAGFHFYKWIDETNPSPEQIADRIIQVLIVPFQRAYAWASGFVKAYFGWEISFDALPSKRSANQ
jgi:hypothetical protein